MLRTFKRWLGLAPPARDWGALPSWAAARGLAFRREVEDRGFVVEGASQGQPWRLEWGPPQREYLIHNELRLRGDFGLPEHLHMLVMSAPLAEALERLAFERFTEPTRTEADIAMPEEARWVSMYPWLDLAPWRRLRQRVRVQGPEAAALRAWLESGLAEALAKGLDAGPLREPAVLDPVVLMTLRGRLYLRTALAEPDPEAIGIVLQLAEAAIAGLPAAVAAMSPIETMAFDAPDSVATAWQTQLDPIALPGWSDRRPESGER
jgi:hypothetical protein